MANNLLMPGLSYIRHKLFEFQAFHNQAYIINFTGIMIYLCSTNYLYATILGGVSRCFWSLFLDLGAQNAIFLHLKTGTFGTYSHHWLRGISQIQKKCFLGHPSIHVAKRPCSGDDDDHNDATDIQNIPGWPPFTVPTTLHLTLFWSKCYIVSLAQNYSAHIWPLSPFFINILDYKLSSDLFRTDLTHLPLFHQFFWF